MLQNVFTFVTTCFPVFTVLQTIIGFADGDGSLVTNTIITILAGAVAVLWKRIEANYKKLETENSNLKLDVSATKSKIDECEKDRKNLREEVEALKERGCTLAHICSKKEDQ
jgi:peptidoglycan hydrolase CwlO-like protein